MNQTFLELLAEIEDFRKGNAIHYRLQDILLVSALAVICNMDTYTEMAMFADHQKKYLAPFCDFRHGPPSHDTFGKVLSRLDPRVLSERFSAWMSELYFHLGKLVESKGMTVAIDGKTICRSGSAEQNASHVLTAFASRMQLVLGQIKTDEKSNEITAIPELLELFQVKDTVVTIDAMGTQKNIAAKIIEKGGDYVLAVKGNQKKLRDDIIWHLHSELQDRSTRELKAKGQYAVTLEKDHGRIEKRECYLSNDLSWFEGLEDWRGIAGVGWIRNTRHVDNKNDKTTTEDHYFIYSLKEAQAKDLLRIKREHWAIENNLHWMLDMAFREDDCRARAKNAAEVMNILRKLALQMLKTCDTCKCGMRSKRKLCGLGIPTALQVLGLVPTGLLIP